MNNKTLISIVIAAIAVIIIVVVATRSSTAPVTTPTPSTSVSAIASPSESPAASPSVSKTLTYADALKKYSATRIQFDTACQAHPTSMVIKKGTAVMLDNRSPKATTITVGTTKYATIPYGFRIIWPTAASYPVTFLIDCGASQNVATLLIQK